MPAGSGYTVTATKSGESAAALALPSQTVNAGSTTNLALALNPALVHTVNVTLTVATNTSQGRQFTCQTSVTLRAPQPQ